MALYVYVGAGGSGRGCRWPTDLCSTQCPGPTIWGLMPVRVRLEPCPLSLGAQKKPFTVSVAGTCWDFITGLPFFSLLHPKAALSSCSPRWPLPLARSPTTGYVGLLSTAHTLLLPSQSFAFIHIWPFSVHITNIFHRWHAPFIRATLAQGSAS